MCSEGWRREGGREGGREGVLVLVCVVSEGEREGVLVFVCVVRRRGKVRLC